MKGDYKEGQMAIEYKKSKHITNVVKAYSKYCKGTKTIIFNVNIEHSQTVTECFNFCGYPCRQLDSNCSEDERREILKWFKETPDAIMCNVMIATVGFDEPTIRNVILNFSTVSVVKFIQCAGRGSRSLPDKDWFNIIDMGGNCIRFGDWSDDRDWQYMFNHPPRPQEGIAPVKTCPDCEGLIHASLSVCPLKNEKGEFCLHEFIRKKTPEEQDLEEMVLITKGINVDDLIHKNNKKYEYYVFLEMGHDVVKNMYFQYEQPTDAIKQKYFKIYYQLCIEWYAKTLANKNGNLKDITDSAWHIKRAKHNFYDLVNRYHHQLTTV